MSFALRAGSRFGVWMGAMALCGLVSQRTEDWNGTGGKLQTVR